MIIELKQVGYAFPVDDQNRFIPALSEIDLTLEHGELCALIGDNGSGKSTLAQIIAGLLEPTTGTVLCSGIKGGLENLSVGYCFQNPDDTLVGRTVIEEIEFSLECRGTEQQNMPHRVNAILSEYGLLSLADRPAGSLSGGEKQKLAVAAASAGKLDLLVLDEPTSHLDPPGRREFLHWLLARTDKAAMEIPATVFITQYHDEAKQFRRVLHLQKGRLAFDGAPGDLPAVRATRRKRPRAHTSVNRLDHRHLLLSLHDAGQGRQEDWPLPECPVRSVTTGVAAGDVIGLLGPIGSGKTTLLAMMAGILSVGSGRIENRLGSSTTSDRSHKENRGPRAPERPILQIQYPERALFAETVATDVAFALDNMGVGQSERDRRVESALAAFGLEPAVFRQRSPFSLSGGEARRTSLAGIWTVGAPVLLLDEPNAALDSDGTALLEDAIAAVPRSGGAVVIASHDLEFLYRTTARVWVMQSGQLIADTDWVQLEADDSPLDAIDFVRAFESVLSKSEVERTP